MRDGTGSGSQRTTPDGTLRATVNPIVRALDRSLSRSNGFFAGTFFGLGPVVGIGVGVAGAVGAGIVAGLVVSFGGLGISLRWDRKAVDRAVRAFGERFPEGSPDRERAHALLFEVQADDWTRRKLREALGAPAEPDGIDRIAQLEQEIVDARGLGPVPIPGLPTDLPAGSPPPPAPAPPARAGVFDYIPLEPEAPRHAGDGPAAPPAPPIEPPPGRR